MPWNPFLIKIYLALSTFRASFIAHKGYNYFPLKKLQLEVSLPQHSKTLKLLPTKSRVLHYCKYCNLAKQ